MMAVAAPVAGRGVARDRFHCCWPFRRRRLRGRADCRAGRPEAFRDVRGRARAKAGPVLSKRSPEIHCIGSDPVQGSLLVAKQFWKRPREAVVAAADDVRPLCSVRRWRTDVGAAIDSRPSETRTSLMRGLADLGVEEILAAVSSAEHPPTWTNSHKRYKVQIVDPRAIALCFVGLVGAENIHTIVVARTPEKRAAVGATTWLAPYWSLVRGAPIVLGHTSSPAVVEADVARWIKVHRLQPRTITVLADYDSIGDNFVELTNGDAASTGGSSAGQRALTPTGEPKNKYQVNTEPLVPTEATKLAAFGVGRIPLQSLEDASVLFARGLIREGLLARQPARLLMVANSSPGRRPLPLCETISRLTSNT